MKRAFGVLVASLVAACGGGGGGGTGGGAGGGSGGAFLVDRETESGTPQLARDGAGVLHLLAAAPAADARGHAYVRYGRCQSSCGTPAGWTTALIADGVFSDAVKLAVEPAARCTSRSSRRSWSASTSAPRAARRPARGRGPTSLRRWARAGRTCRVGAPSR